MIPLKTVRDMTALAALLLLSLLFLVGCGKQPTEKQATVAGEQVTLKIEGLH